MQERDRWLGGDGKVLFSTDGFFFQKNLNLRAPWSESLRHGSGNDEGWAAASGAGGCRITPASYLKPPSLSISRILRMCADQLSRGSRPCRCPRWSCQGLQVERTLSLRLVGVTHSRSSSANLCQPARPCGPCGGQDSATTTSTPLAAAIVGWEGRPRCGQASSETLGRWMFGSPLGNALDLADTWPMMPPKCLVSCIFGGGSNGR